MTDGLEVTVLMLNEVLKDNEVFRLDAEYFKKATLRLIKKIRSGQHEIIGRSYVISKLAGFEFTEYFTPDNMESSNFYIALTSKNIQNETLNLSEFITIDKDVADKNLIRSKLYKHDVILSYTGEYRRSLVLQEEDNKFQLGPNVCRLRVFNSSINSFYLSTFFNCLIGQKILDREKTLSAQPTVAMSRIRTIAVPLLSQEFQLAIEQLVKAAHSRQTESKTLYAQAETLLLNELGLSNWQPTKDNTAEVNLADSFLQSGRLDAEYYQVKYGELEKKIKEYNNGFCTLKDLAVSYSAGFAFESSNYVDEGFNLIRINNIKGGNLELDNCAKLSENEAMKSPKDIVQENDILISMSGTIGSSCKIPKNIKAVINQRILKIVPKNYNFEVLPLIINSIIGKMQLNRLGTGGVQTNLSNQDILNIYIPLISKNIQDEISFLIECSQSTQAEGKRLLLLAKQAVELAIEQGEEVAAQLIANPNY